jgi:hypothetical protein
MENSNVSNKNAVAAKESGAFHFKDKGHEKSKHPQGAHDPGKHEAPLKEQGAYARKDKPLVHSEQVGVTHSGRALPDETILKDSKIITSAGRLAKRNEK